MARELGGRMTEVQEELGPLGRAKMLVESEVMIILWTSQTAVIYEH